MRGEYHFPKVYERFTDSVKIASVWTLAAGGGGGGGGGREGGEPPHIKLCCAIYPENNLFVYSLMHDLKNRRCL